jgi:hypothetical protein
VSSSASVPARSRWRVRLPSAARVDVDAAALRATAIEALIVVVGFGALAIIATWPVSRDFSSWITAPVPGNDQLGYLFDFRYAAEHGLPVIRDYIQTDVAVPFGRPASAAANLTLLGTLLPAVLITKLAGAIAAYNVMTLTGLSLSGAAMYLLVRWLGLGRGPAVWAGAVFVLFPYHLFAATAFVTIVQYQALPLVLMALVAWTVRPRLASGAAVVAADALCWLTFPYFGAMATVMTAVGLVVAASVHVGTAGWLGASAGSSPGSSASSRCPWPSSRRSTPAGRPGRSSAPPPSSPSWAPRSPTTSSRPAPAASSPASWATGGSRSDRSAANAWSSWAG